MGVITLALWCFGGILVMVIAFSAMAESKRNALQRLKSRKGTLTIELNDLKEEFKTVKMEEKMARNRLAMLETARQAVAGPSPDLEGPQSDGAASETGGLAPGPRAPGPETPGSDTPGGGA